MTDLVKLTEYSVWANEMWIAFVEQSFSGDDYLLKRMGHILLGERAWFQRISGEQPDRDIWKRMNIQELRELHRAHRDIYRNLLSSGRMESRLAYKRFTGEEYQSPVSDILLHLSTHGVHHRGQMATYVSARGVAPINTDFIQFCIVNGK